MIPGSALRRLEAQTGLKASKSEDRCYRLDIMPGVAFFSFAADEAAACRDLREQNLKRVRRIVMEKQRFLCAGCNMLRPLQGHHVLFRSRWRPKNGPLDVESNIEGLCQECHEKEHLHHEPVREAEAVPREGGGEGREA